MKSRISSNCLKDINEKVVSGYLRQSVTVKAMSSGIRSDLWSRALLITKKTFLLYLKKTYD
jgi:hypothetical protein